MKPTALLLLAGIALCMLLVAFTSPQPQQAPAAASQDDHDHDHASHDHDHDHDHASHEHAPTPSAPAGPSELSSTDQATGSGDEAVFGKSVTVEYTGWLYDPNAADKKGNRFDSSRGREPFTFRLGGGEVIRGWDQGVNGMKVGGKRTLVIPPALGYGANGQGPIPANSTLLFEVELISVK
jgi:FKBP-type peptidyl-prolyl cis-trans isomerase FkpA